MYNSGKLKNSLTLRTLPSLRRTRLSFHYLGGTREVDAIPTSMKVMIKTFSENWDSKFFFKQMLKGSTFYLKMIKRFCLIFYIEKQVEKI